MISLVISLAIYKSYRQHRTLEYTNKRSTYHTSYYIVSKNQRSREELEPRTTGL
jgi:hypothetical protein